VKRILTLSGSVAIAAALLGGCTAAVGLDPDPVPTQTVTQPVFVVPPCMEEDGPGPCYWDAQNVGNGVGTSYFIDSNGEFYYPAP
jgi:hypothetical protein